MAAALASMVRAAVVLEACLEAYSVVDRYAAFTIHIHTWTLTKRSTPASPTATTATVTPAHHQAEHIPAPHRQLTTPVLKAASTAAVPLVTRVTRHPHPDSSHTAKPTPATVHNNIPRSHSTANSKATDPKPGSAASQPTAARLQHMVKDHQQAARLEATDNKVRFFDIFGLTRRVEDSSLFSRQG
jgi:hypothetical protein